MARRRNSDRPTGDTPAVDVQNRRQRIAGQGLTEFALVLPALILLLLIAVDFGRLFSSYVTLTNATRVAANYGATNPGKFTGTPDTTTFDVIVNQEIAGLNCPLRSDGGGNLPPIPTFPAGTGLSGTARVAMTCDFALLTPIIGNLFGGGLPISVSTDFPIRTGAIANIGGSTTLPPPGSPVADFSFTGVSGGTIDGSGNVTGTAPVTVNVANASTNADTWTWSWGDGSPDEFGATPGAHTFTVTATRTVTLTVTNTVGFASRSRTVTVSSAPAPVPVAGFYGTPVAVSPRYAAGGGSSGTAITGSLPLVVDFTNLSTDGTAFSWDFGDGTTASTSTAPQHQYTALGVYTVVLSVTAPAGGNPYTRTSYVTTGCVVPNFANTVTSDAIAAWRAANFTGTLEFQPEGANGYSGRSSTPPTPAQKVKSQTIQGGIFIPATRRNKNDPWACDGDIVLRYAP